MKDQVTLSEHRIEWTENFALIKKRINEVCGDLLQCVEHIGSTAIANISAKNIIDIQCAVEDFNQVDLISEKLDLLGLSLNENINQDHVPFKDPDYYEDGWEKRFFTGKIDGIQCNCHIRIKGSSNWNFALQFRDYLNQNVHVAKVYEQIKQRLSAAGVDRESYCLIKDPVCDLLYCLFSETDVINRVSVYQKK